MDTKYNGWTNYETWCVNLWLSNEEPSYRYWREEAERCLREASDSTERADNRIDVAEGLLANRLHTEMAEAPVLQQASIFTDLLIGALAEVDWHEIARDLLEDIAPDAGGDTPEVSETTSPTNTDGTPKFPLGQTVATPAARGALSAEDVAAAMRRHHGGDWGDVCDEDRESNEFALREGLRLFSVYHSEAGVKFWIITEADRSVTTVQLPEDY